MGSVSVSSCRCMFVSCVHTVAVLNAAFCMTCSLLMLVEDAIGDHTEEAYCGMDPHDGPHMFKCTAHPSDLSPMNLWDKPVKTIWGLSFLYPGNLD